jgi:16S rRNA (cytosine967-C5)-methyltransferase
LAELPGLQLQPIDPADWPGLEAAITAKGEFRTTPDMLREIGGLDGFYAAVIAKI